MIIHYIAKVLSEIKYSQQEEPLSFYIKDMVAKFMSSNFGQPLSPKLSFIPNDFIIADLNIILEYMPPE
jgi:hypothetical protein